MLPDRKNAKNKNDGQPSRLSVRVIKLLADGGAALAVFAEDQLLGMGQSLSGLVGARRVGGRMAHNARHAANALVDGQALAQSSEAVGGAGASFLNVQIPNGQVRLADSEGDAMGAGGAGASIVEVTEASGLLVTLGSLDLNQTASLDAASGSFSGLALGESAHNGVQGGQSGNAGANLSGVLQKIAAILEFHSFIPP